MGNAIGIDLGTTNTIVTFRKKNGNLASLTYEGESVIPSVLYFISKDDWLIGQKAKDRFNFYRNKAGVVNFKSHLDDKEFVYEVEPENGEPFKLKPQKAAALFLNKVIKGIEKKLIKSGEGYISNVVITVPAKFNGKQKELTKKAAEKAGFDTVKLAAEPAAAAIAFRDGLLDSNQEITVLVYDFGGGTFDISVMTKKNGKFKEIETNGDSKLGGNDLTMKLADYFSGKVMKECDLCIPLDEDEFDEEDAGISFEDYKKNLYEIIEKANIAKENLSFDDEFEVFLNIITPDDPAYIVNFVCTRKEFEKLIKKSVARSIEKTKEVVEIVEKKGVTIDEIVLAGGTSNIPLIKKMISEEIPNYKISDDEDFTTLISRGAAILSEKIEGEGDEDQGVSLTNYQMGVSVKEGITYNKFCPIIKENVELPVSGKKEFSLNYDGQRSFSLAYYDYDVKNYPHSIRTDEEGINEEDKLYINNLPEGLKVNNTVLEVEFTCEKDGQVTVSVKVKDKAGNLIVAKDMTSVKESQLE